MRGLPRALAVGLVLAAPPAAAATLQVEVDGAEPGAGPVYVTICQGGLAEASCPEGRSGEGRRFAFDLPPGTYAVAAYQDENGNGRLDEVRSDRLTPQADSEVSLSDRTSLVVRYA